MTEAAAADVDRLYGLPLDEFTLARDETARRLRGEGRRQDAAAVKALRKPSNPAWIVNMLRRRHPSVVDDLFAAGERLRTTQLGGEGAKLHDAMRAERSALDRAMRNAEEIATHARLATAITLQRVQETLHLAALDPDVAADVRRGVLVREGRASGFAGLADLAPPSEGVKRPAGQPDPPRSGASKRSEPKETAATARRARQLAEARERVTDARRALKEAERELSAAARLVAEATRQQERARTRVEQARTRCEAAGKRVAELEKGR
jgi:hypothetical protein